MNTRNEMNTRNDFNMKDEINTRNDINLKDDMNTRNLFLDNINESNVIDSDSEESLFTKAINYFV